MSRRVAQVDGATRRRVSVSARRASGGWTLIELVVTLTVLTILTLGVVPLIKTSVKRQREQELREVLRQMRDSINEFHRDTIGMTCTGGAQLNPQQQQQVQQQVQQQQQGLYLDPRSKVVISDCAIFTTDNPDHYPPTLEALVDGVSITSRAGAGAAGGAPNVGSVEGNMTERNKLEAISTKKKHYLRAIPVDPMTGKAEWDLRSTYDAADASEWGGENVFDVRSKSTATALDGSKYNEW